MKTIGLTLVLLGTIPLPLPARLILAGSASGSCRVAATSRWWLTARPSIAAVRKWTCTGSSRLTAPHSCSKRKPMEPAVGPNAIRSSWPSTRSSFSRSRSIANRETLSITRPGRFCGLTNRSMTTLCATTTKPSGLIPASYYRGRGRVWQLRNAWEKALPDFNEAIKLDPKSARAFIGRGTAWASQKKYGKAIDDASEAIWLDPLSITAYEIRGRAWYAKKEFAKAIVDYNTALRLNSRGINLTATAATPGLLSTGTTGPCLISTKRSRSMKSVPMPTAAAHGSGPPVPSANTATAPRPSPPRRAPANLRAITTSNRSKRWRQPTPRQVISSRLSNGKHGPTGYARTLRKSRRARHGSNYSSRKSPCANLGLSVSGTVVEPHRCLPTTKIAPGRTVRRGDRMQPGVPLRHFCLRRFQAIE